MKRIQTSFATAEADDTDAAFSVDTGMETLSLSSHVNEGELFVKLMSGERELYEGPSDELSSVFEVYRAVNGLKGNREVISSLRPHKAHPDVEALLYYLSE